MHESAKMAKLNRGSVRRSIIYRHDAEIKIRKIMEHDPYISLVALGERTGYSRQTIANIYRKIRKSSEWRTWITNYTIARV